MEIVTTGGEIRVHALFAFGLYLFVESEATSVLPTTLWPNDCAFSSSRDCTEELRRCPSEPGLVESIFARVSEVLKS